MSVAEPILVFVAMFAAAGQGGIRAFHLDATSGRLTAGGDMVSQPHAFFLAVAPDGRTLYANRADAFGSPVDEEVVAWRIVDRQGRLEKINHQSTRGSASCFLDIDPAGRCLLIANYTSGSVAALPIRPDGSLGPAASVITHAGAGTLPDRQAAPHAHALLATAVGVDGTIAYAADLGIDRVIAYRLDPATATLVPAEGLGGRTPPGSGPRHLALHPDGHRLYCINELSNTVTVFDREIATGALVPGPTVSTLPDGFTGVSHCADVKITPDGRFLYGTNRGHDSIAVFRIGDMGRLERVAIVPSQGRGPQNLAITPDGRLLLCANMAGNSLAVFTIDASSGMLEPAGNPLELRSPACIRLITPATVAEP
jgi:6-phosphogluconolactonase